MRKFHEVITNSSTGELYAEDERYVNGCTEECDQVFVLGSVQGGLLTSRLRPCSVPRSNLTRFYRIRLEPPRKLPDFAGIPVWLKPFLNVYNQMGYREERLCSVYHRLSQELISAFRSACSAVMTLAFSRMKHVQDIAKYELEQIEDEQWLYEGLGLSDHELETYDTADFGVVR